MVSDFYTPSQFGFVVAFGGTSLGALLLRFMISKIRERTVAQKYALLAITGFSYGRFTGLEALNNPTIAGSTAGAALALIILWQRWYFRQRKQKEGEG